MSKVTLDEILADAIASEARADGMPSDYVPNEHRIVRVAPNYWDTMMKHRVRGYAGDAEKLHSTEPDTVLCTYADGRQEVRTVSEIRGKRQSVKQTRREVKGREMTEAEKYLPSMRDILGDYN